MKTRAEIEAAIEETRIAERHYEDDLLEAQLGIADAVSQRAALEADLAEVAKHDGSAYVQAIFDFAVTCPNRWVTKTEEAASVNNLTYVNNRNPAAQVYVEIDRALLADTIAKAGGDLALVVGTALWTTLWPVAVRVDDEGDIVLHVTSGERAQFGHDDVSEER